MLTANTASAKVKNVTPWRKSGIQYRFTTCTSKNPAPGLAGTDEDGKPKDVFYSLGWINRVVGEGKINHWHTGSLPGTATILVRRHDGRNWVVLFNARVSPHASHLGRAIDPLLHAAADEVEQWPSENLFPQFE